MVVKLASLIPQFPFPHLYNHIHCHDFICRLERRPRGYHVSSFHHRASRNTMSLIPFILFFESSQGIPKRAELFIFFTIIDNKDFRNAFKKNEFIGLITTAAQVSPYSSNSEDFLTFLMHFLVKSRHSARHSRSIKIGVDRLSPILG